MRHVAQRLGFRLPRGLLSLLLIVAVLVGGAFWIGPFRPLPPDLRLVALGADGRFHENVALPVSANDTLGVYGSVVARYPLVLAVQNVGSRVGRPQRLALSIPSRFRLTDRDGGVYPGRSVVGNPLSRYVFNVRTGVVPGGSEPASLGAIDTVWIEPQIASYYCTAGADSVPEFIPAPRFDPSALSTLKIFYAFSNQNASRQTGVLSVQFDPASLQRQPAPQPARSAVQVREPEYPRPEVGSLRDGGSVIAECGEPGEALTLQSSIWLTPEGGRWIVVYHGGAPRKYLFDLNRDSIIELEMWDPDNDGRFEAARTTRMPIPEFLLPPPARIRMDRDSLRADSIRVDSIARDSLRLDSLRVAAARGDSAALARVAADSVRAARAAAADSIRVEGQRVREFRYSNALFRDTAAGPFRFYEAYRESRRPRPRPRTDSIPLLGVPVNVPTIPTAPRDTMVRDTMVRDTSR